MKILSFITLTFLLINNICAQNKKNFNSFAHAIHQVETNGRIGNIINKKSGALGPLQIKKVCYLDVKDKVGGSYEKCIDFSFSKKVLYFYCLKYEKKALEKGDWEILSRLWNCGPSWKNKKNNEYWLKVKSKL